MEKTFLLFDPETHQILATVHTNNSVSANMIGHPHKAEIAHIQFAEDLLFNPKTRTVYAGPKVLE